MCSQMRWISMCVCIITGSQGMPNFVRIVIQLPVDLKTQLDNLKQQGYTASGFIRAMLEREFAKLEEKPVPPFPVGKRVNSR